MKNCSSPVFRWLQQIQNCTGSILSILIMLDIFMYYTPPDFIHLTNKITVKIMYLQTEWKTMWILISSWSGSTMFIKQDILFVLMFYISVNQFSVMSGRFPVLMSVFLSWSGSKQRRLKDTKNASGESQTSDPLISSPTIYHWATTLIVKQDVSPHLGLVRQGLTKSVKSKYVRQRLTIWEIISLCDE